MSFLRTKIFVASLSIVSMMFGPYVALAQNWTPPTQMPTGGNVPSPVNVGSLLQTKVGPLTIGGEFISSIKTKLSGDTVIQPDSGNAGIMVNFLNSFFYGNVSVGDGTPFNGSGNEIPADLSVYGKFKYQTADNNGNPEPVYPGYVLATNDEGFTEWVDPATLPGGGGGNDARLPSGTTQGETLYWDTATSKWKVASNVKINPNTTVMFQAMTGPLGLRVLNDGTVTSNKVLSVGGDFKVSLSNSIDPLPGSVLKLADNNGTVAWGDALPAGGNNGDVLTWNSTTNQWESTSINVTTGNLPLGTSVGQSLRWTGLSTGWQPTDAVKTPSAGTVMVGADSANTAISIGNITSTSILQVSANTLNLNPHTIKIPLNNTAATGKILASTDNNGTLGWTDPSSLSGGLPAATTGQTLWYTGTAWEPTSKLIWSGDNENLKFDGTKLYLPGGSNSLEPSTGRFMFSKDDLGEASWNKYLVYQDMPYGQNQHIDSISILPSNDSNRTSAFANYGDYTYLANRLEVDGLTFLNNDTHVDGMSTLNGDTKVTTSGDLYLDGIDALPPTQMDLGGNPVSMNYDLDTLCINRLDFKVVLCDPSAGKPLPLVIGQHTETFGPGTSGITFPFPDQAPGDVTVESCAGGGGGGGGGHGWEDGSSNGHGGGGGGGGDRGECSTNTINDPSDGDQLTWGIGPGGGGGAFGHLWVVDGSMQPPQSNHPAGGGQPGGGTTVYFNGSQIADLDGGGGGYPGGDASGAGVGIGGNGGTPDLLIATAPWHKGNNGQLGTDSSTGNYTGMGFGGHGGHGRENVAGQGGVGGVPGQPGSGAEFGGHGQTAAPSFGGGGGGGGSGKWYDFSYLSGNDNGVESHGGWGSSGGAGYVKVTYPVYVAQAAPPTSHLFASSGTFNISEIPTSVTNVTIEAWGGGGGGGLAQNANGGLSNSFNRYGGGGGSGGYAKSIVQRSSLSPTLSIIVGGGGVASADGGQTTVVGGGQIATANGGVGGADSIQVMACPTGGTGGLNNYGTNQAVNGGNGGACGVLPVNPINPPAYPNGQGGVQSTGGYGTGGNGAKLFGSLASPVAAQGGQAGRVLISW